MPTYETQQAPAGQRRTRWLSHAWQRGFLLGVLVILLSLCHGVVVPVEASAPGDGTMSVAVAQDEQPPFRDCAVSKRLIALSDRRGAATALDLPVRTPGLTAHIPEAARGVRVAPHPLPDNHRAFLQVFRI